MGARSEDVHEQPSISWVRLGVLTQGAQERNPENKYLSAVLGIVGRIRNGQWLQPP
jgi:hypothetical protein